MNLAQGPSLAQDLYLLLRHRGHATRGVDPAPAGPSARQRTLSVPAVFQRASRRGLGEPPKKDRSTTHPRAAHKAADQWARWGTGPLNRPTSFGGPTRRGCIAKRIIELRARS